MLDRKNDVLGNAFDRFKEVKDDDWRARAILADLIERRPDQPGVTGFGGEYPRYAAAIAVDAWLAARVRTTMVIEKTKLAMVIMEASRVASTPWASAGSPT